MKLNTTKAKLVEKFFLKHCKNKGILKELDILLERKFGCHPSYPGSQYEYIPEYIPEYEPQPLICSEMDFWVVLY